MNTRWQMVGVLLAVLLAATVLACLFSFLLPPAASLLAPTRTLTPTITPTLIATLTPPSTFTPLPVQFVTPNMTLFPGFTIYWQRDLWEDAIGSDNRIEDFEKDRNDYGELNFPYFTGNRFILTGQSAAQIIRAPELLPSQNLLHFRDWEIGLTFTLPDDTSTNALGFDYASQEDWQLTVLNIDIILPNGRNRFVGVVLYEETVKNFRFFGPDTAQGGLSMDNISYVP